jgi:alpha/beta superfamily hydrolase
VVAVGFSFGAAMTVMACCGRGQSAANVRALVALGLPTQTKNQSFSYPSLHTCSIPKFFLSGDHDQFAPAALLVQLAASAADPKRLVLLPGADHFFSGHLAAMQSSLACWLKEQLS